MILPTAIERLQFLMDRSSNESPLPAEQRGECARVRGCQAQVWVVGEGQDGRWRFRSDSDAPMVKALAKTFIADIHEQLVQSGFINLTNSRFNRVGCISQ